MWREALGEVNGEQGRGGSDDAGQRRGERRGQHRYIPCLGAGCRALPATPSGPCGPPLCSGSGGIRPCAAVLIWRPPSPGFAPPSSTSLLYAQAPPTAAAVSLSASRWKRKARLRRPVQNLALLTMADLPRTKKANQRKGNGRSRSTEGGRAARGTQAPRRPTPSRHPAFPRLVHASRAAVAGDEVGATRR